MSDVILLNGGPGTDLREGGACHRESIWSAQALFDRTVDF
jgi:S-methylmethionine-dependent homocysteine/selenocysteine methylase